MRNGDEITKIVIDGFWVRVTPFKANVPHYPQFSLYTLHFADVHATFSLEFLCKSTHDGTVNENEQQ